MQRSRKMSCASSSVGTCVRFGRPAFIPVIPPSVKICLKGCKMKLDHRHVLEIN